MRSSRKANTRLHLEELMEPEIDPIQHARILKDFGKGDTFELVPSGNLREQDNIMLNLPNMQICRCISYLENTDDFQSAMFHLLVGCFGDTTN